jgi:hypothetical protein
VEVETESVQRHAELQGLKIMMALINNWDLKDSNNVIMKDGERAVLRDQRSRRDVWTREHDADLLAITRSRNNPSNYAKSNFFEKVKGDRVCCTSAARIAG